MVSSSVLDRVDGLRDRIVEHRLRRRLVLWGGRPGRDLQFGSDEDRRLQRLQRAPGFARFAAAVDEMFAGLRAASRVLAAANRAQNRTAALKGGYGLAEALEAQRTQPGIPLEEAVAALRAGVRAGASLKR